MRLGRGYSGYTALSGADILRDGTIRLTLTRIAGQVLFDIYRTGGSLLEPESILSPDVESVIDRIARIEISYENPTTELRFDENGRCGLYVFHCCRDSIRTIPALCYDPEQVEDVDTSSEDHIYDEWRYLLMAHPLPLTKPRPRRRGFSPLD